MDKKIARLPQLRKNSPSQMVGFSKELGLAFSQKYQKTRLVNLNGLANTLRHPYKKRGSEKFAVSQSTSPKLKSEFLDKDNIWELPFVSNNQEGFRPAIRKRWIKGTRRKQKKILDPCLLSGVSKSILMRNVSKTENSRLIDGDGELKEEPIIIQKPSKITIYTKLNKSELTKR